MVCFIDPNDEVQGHKEREKKNNNSQQKQQKNEKKSMRPKKGMIKIPPSIVLNSHFIFSIFLIFVVGSGWLFDLLSFFSSGLVVVSFSFLFYPFVCGLSQSNLDNYPAILLEAMLSFSLYILSIGLHNVFLNKAAGRTAGGFWPSSI